MKLQIVSVEGEAAVLLPESVLRLLGVGPGDTVDVEIAGDGSLQIANPDPDFRRAMRIAERVMVEYHDTLKAIGND